MADGTMNLMLPRSDKSVWDKPSLATTIASFDQERWIATAWGSALAIIGGRRGGLSGCVIATVGVALAVRAAMGRHDLATARRKIERVMQDRGWAAADVVEAASEESFPASDSPSWTPTAGATTKK